MIVEFTPNKDSFGFNSFKSFLDHIDYFQYVNHIKNGDPVIKFIFDENGIPIVDVFELYKDTPSIKFGKLNIIVVETLRQFLSIQDSLDHSKRYIVFSESLWDVSKNKTASEYELIFMPWDLVDCQNRLANRSNLYFHLLDLNFFNNYTPNYEFLCLVGRSKEWRDIFVEKLQQNIDLSNTLTSYYGQNLGNSKLLEIDIPYDRNNSKSEFDDKFYRPIRIQGTDIQYNLSYFTKNELFYQTKFSVVVETEAELEEYHITEKTIKCLILGHPFVVVGTPGYLNFLHKLGFITYNKIFDESYDKILDLNDRMDAVINLISQLKKITFDIDQLKTIQEHNLNALIKLRHKETYQQFLQLMNDIRLLK